MSLTVNWILILNSATIYYFSVKICLECLVIIIAELVPCFSVDRVLHSDTHSFTPKFPDIVWHNSEANDIAEIEL